MPLSIGAFVTAPETPTDPPANHAPRATWTAPDGSLWELSGPAETHGWLTTPGIAGWGATPVTIVTDPLARGGVEVRHVRVEPRRITWPLNIFGDHHLQWLARYRALMRAFTMTSRLRRPGTLTVFRQDGTARAIEGFYEQGFEGTGGENWLFANPVLTLFCPDGHWRDVTAEAVSRTHQPDGATPFLDPYLTVSSSQILGQTEIVNGGDVDAWPSWTIKGPMSAFTAEHLGLDASFTLTHPLGGDSLITIDTGPVRPMIRGPEGENLSGALNWPGAELWPLTPGTNNVRLLMEGAELGSSIELRYYRRYETA